MTKQPIWNKDFIITSISTFLLFTAFYSLLSSMPIYVSDTLNGGGKESGLVITVFIIAAVIFRPLSGKWLDQYGKKKVLLLSLLLFLVSSCLYLIVQNLAQLLLLRFIHGISFGVASTATGAIAVDILPAEKKGEGIGYYALSYNTAMFAGPFLGLAVLNQFPFTIYFTFLVIASCLSLLIVSNLTINTNSAKQKSNIEKGPFWSEMIEIKAVPAAFTAMFRLAQWLVIRNKEVIKYVPYHKEN